MKTLEGWPCSHCGEEAIVVVFATYSGGTVDKRDRPYRGQVCLCVHCVLAAAEKFPTDTLVLGEMPEEEKAQLIREFRAARLGEQTPVMPVSPVHGILSPARDGLLDAVREFLGEDMGCVIVHPGTDEDMTRLDVPTPTWEALHLAMDDIEKTSR